MPRRGWIRIERIVFMDPPEHGVEGRVWYELGGDLPEGSCSAMMQPFSRAGARNRAGHVWQWDGNREAPTLSPSYLCTDGVNRVHLFLRAGKIDAPSARVLIEAELKLAAKENPARFGDRSVADITVRPGAAAPESADVTKAWIARVVAGTPAGSNVIKLVPHRSSDEGDADAVRGA